MAFMVWGLEDKTHEPVGTTFYPSQVKGKGNEDLYPWLVRGIAPSVQFCFYDVEYEGQHLVLLAVAPTTGRPVSFWGQEYIRVGSYKKPLSAHPSKEEALWTLSKQASFESGIALKDVSSDIIFEYLNYPAVFELLSLPLPDNRAGILNRLQQEQFIAETEVGDHFNVTNLGAILFAKDLTKFSTLARKALRVVFYDGPNRTTTTIREQEGRKGYAVGFEGLVDYLNEHLPMEEKIIGARRLEKRTYPEIAIRELVANAFIHQDFTQSGNGPTVEVFSDRVEITNPGKPLIDPRRFIDEPPRSRNEALAAFMRRVGVCEELGSGVDKVVAAAERSFLKAPDFQVKSGATKVILFGPVPFADMSKKDRLRACYQHACLCHVSNTQLTNPSLRERFNISQKNAAMVTRLIKEAVKARLIKPYDPDSSSRKYAKYIPYWA